MDQSFGHHIEMKQNSILLFSKISKYFKFPNISKQILIVIDDCWIKLTFMSFLFSENFYFSRYFVIFKFMFVCLSLFFSQTKEIEIKPQANLTRLQKVREWAVRPKTIQSFAYFYIFFSLSACHVTLGPALPSLQKQVGSTLGEIAIVSVLRSVGYIIGSAGGPIFDYVNVHWLMSGGMALMGVCMVTVPFVSSLWFVAALVCTMGAVGGFLDTALNVSLLWLHGDDSGPYMNSLHVWWGAGSFVTPFVVNAVISNSVTEDASWAWWIVACLCFPPILWILKYPKPKTEQENKTKGFCLPLPETSIITIISTFLLAYVGAEIAISITITSFAIVAGDASYEVAPIFTSIYWIGLTLGRVVGIPVSMYFTPMKQIYINSIICFISITTWLIFYGDSTMLWIVVFCYGIGMGSSFPAAITLAESYVVLTGRIGTIFILCGAIGEMAIPSLVLNVLEDDPKLLPIVLLICAIVAFLVISLAPFAGKRTNKYKERQLKELGKTQVVDINSEQGNIQLEDNNNEQSEKKAETINNNDEQQEEGESFLNVHSNK